MKSVLKFQQNHRTFHENMTNGCITELPSTTLPTVAKPLHDSPPAQHSPPPRHHDDQLLDEKLLDPRSPTEGKIFIVTGIEDIKLTDQLLD